VFNRRKAIEPVENKEVPPSPGERKEKTRKKIPSIPFLKLKITKYLALYSAF